MEEISKMPWFLFFYLVYLCVPLLVLSYACSLLEGALTSAIAGESHHIRWPGRHVGQALRSGLAGLICFLAGPVLGAGAGFLYWLRCGDPGFLDWLILAELNVVASGYGVFALLAVAEGGRLYDANPIRVGQIVGRLGHRGLLVALVASVLTALHGLLAFAAVLRLSSEPVTGWLLLGCAWASGLFWGTFLLRLLGVWWYHTRRRIRAYRPAL
jgi:hypothetical protein